MVAGPAKTTVALPSTCALRALRMVATGSAVSFIFLIPRPYSLPSTAAMSGVSSEALPLVASPIGCAWKNPPGSPV